MSHERRKLANIVTLARVRLNELRATVTTEDGGPRRQIKLLWPSVTIKIDAS